MNTFIANIRLQLKKDAPDLLPLFETMSQEALFAWNWLKNDLESLPAGASLLEVGGGIFLLSCHLARQGFDITTVDPLGDGFSEFGKLRDCIMQVARASGAVPSVVEAPIESFISDKRFDFALSVNVMEHVTDPQEAMKRVFNVLKPGASYRFFCPNYIFPYEPHFNIPTLFSKKLTEKFLGKKIFDNRRLSDPRGIWRSLNWITTFDVSRYAQGQGWQRMDLRRDTLVEMFERVVTDTAFSQRRSDRLVAIIHWLVDRKIHRLVKWFPVFFHPVMDCRLTKKSLA